MYDDAMRSPRRELTDEDRRWMALDLGAMLVRSLAFALVAACLGVSMSVLLQPAAAPANMASAAPAAD